MAATSIKKVIEICEEAFVEFNFYDRFLECCFQEELEKIYPLVNAELDEYTIRIETYQIQWEPIPKRRCRIKLGKDLKERLAECYPEAVI